MELKYEINSNLGLGQTNFLKPGYIPPLGTVIPSDTDHS